jgi:4'-phosphopantetheinyl transferase superfamily protein
MPDVGQWETFFREALGLPLVLGYVTMLDEGAEWSRAERQLADSFDSPLRRDTWLRGRSALKTVLSRLGEDTDTSPILFPAPRYSLSHSAHAAVAVGVPGGSSIEGIGVDIELHRTPPEQSTRFFLADRELRWLAGTQDKDSNLLRLWTVKEALFKADPDNAGRLLTNYRIEDPSRDVGRAFAFDNALEYASLAIPGGIVSVAIKPGERG